MGASSGPLDQLTRDGRQLQSSQCQEEPLGCKSWWAGNRFPRYLHILNWSVAGRDLVGSAAKTHAAPHWPRFAVAAPPISPFASRQSFLGRF